MSPERQIRGGQAVPVNNVYTAILALACLVVLATAAFVVYKCYVQYDIFFQLP